MADQLVLFLDAGVGQMPDLMSIARYLGVEFGKKILKSALREKLLSYLKGNNDIPEENLDESIKLIKDKLNKRQERLEQAKHKKNQSNKLGKRRKKELEIGEAILKQYQQDGHSGEDLTRLTRLADEIGSWQAANALYNTYRKEKEDVILEDVKPMQEEEPPKPGEMNDETPVVFEDIKSEPVPDPPEPEYKHVFDRFHPSRITTPGIMRLKRDFYYHY